ncbi:MAG: pyridoxamine 5'-phosphate oxidase family protein [Betaproteobacteria bacterium]
MDARNDAQDLHAFATPLATLLRGQRTAALGTLREGAPLVSMVLYLAAGDFSAFFFHVSRLAWHTQDMLADPRVSLSVAATDDGRRNPQVLERVSLRGEAVPFATTPQEHAGMQERWLARFPQSAINFELADFLFFRFVPRDARFVAGFGRIHTLTADDLVAASGQGA